jgi:hypothetical protein
MSSTEDIIGAMRREIRRLLETAMEGVLTKARGVLEEADQERIQRLVELAEDVLRDLQKSPRSMPRTSPRLMRGALSCTPRWRPCTCTKRRRRAT